MQISRSKLSLFASLFNRLKLETTARGISDQHNTQSVYL